MFPVVANSSATAPAPPTLVATSLPENFAQRVPYTNVSPSVSSVQIRNNASGNGSYASVDYVAQLSVPVIEGEGATGAVDSVASSKIPAAFLAQIIGQDVPPSLQGALSNVLASYDQLVVNSFVKYRPSNAQLPPPPPSGVFGKILAQENNAPPVVQHIEAPPVETKPEPVQASQPVQTQEPVQEIEVVAPEIKQAAPVEKPTQPQPTAKKSSSSSVKVAIAYLMSEARVDLEAPPAVTASI
jgi:hypothetical protein